METQFIFIDGHQQFGSIVEISLENVDECHTIPVIGNRYYCDTIDNKIRETGQDVTQYRIYLPNREFMSKTICLTYLIRTKCTNVLYKPKQFKYQDINEWIELIFLWNDVVTGDMVPHLIPLNKTSIIRTIYMTKPIEDPHLLRWAGKYHYQEAINCPIPPPVCACCSQTRLSNPSEGDYVSSTRTSYIYNDNDISFEFDNNGFKLNFNPYICENDTINGKVKRYNSYYSHISYDPKLESVSCSCPSINNIDPHDYSTHWFDIHKGKVFEKDINKWIGCSMNIGTGLGHIGEHKYKYMYPRWVTDDTIWYCHGIGSAASFNGETLYDYATGSIDFSNNQLAQDIYMCCVSLYKNLSDLMPKDKIESPQNLEEMFKPTAEHDDRCGICWETDGNDWVKLNECVHKFHRNCIVPHLMTHNKCPYCMKQQQMVQDLYESLIPMINLLDIFNEQLKYITNNTYFLRLVELVKIFKYEHFSTVEWCDNILEYYEMYKNESLNTHHIFLKKVYDGRYNAITLINGYHVEYCDTLEKLLNMCQQTWPDRKVIILSKDDTYHPKETPTDVVTVNVT